MSAPYRTYLDESMLSFPFCPGCGHGQILDQLDAALVRLQWDPRDVVLVTDIGCQGLSDRYFATNAVHGLHGRSLTYATGIKLAHPDLHVIVLMGDGGCGIGGAHLLNAARRNIGLTLLVFNNLNFGMTGGQHSVTTPPGADTATTAYGHLERPLDLCATVGINGASFAARATTFDPALPDLLAEALQTEGFALLDIWELCTAYFVPHNTFNRKRLEQTLADLDFPTGVTHRAARPEYSRAYRAAVADQVGQAVLPPSSLTPRFAHSLERAQHVVVAGAAGARIGSAAATFAQGAILAGLWATQRNDYPVTVKTGHSLAEVTLSPTDTPLLGAAPDALIVLFPEGLKVARTMIEALGEDALLLIDAALAPVETRARVVPLDFGATRHKRERWATMALAALLRLRPLYPLAAFEAALASRPTYAEANLAAIAESAALLATG